MDAGKGCKLSFAADMLLMLTDGLVKHPSVDTCKGRVGSVNVEQPRNFTVQLNQDKLAETSSSDPHSDKISTERVVLCTGSAPTNRDVPYDIPGLRNLDLDTALSPSMLSETLSSDSPLSIAVIGASHSAILVLWNLSNLALTTHSKLRIKWFTRHSLRYAEYMDGWILRDNTGLKGEAADWARANLEPATFSSSPVSQVVEKIAYERKDEDAVMERNLKGCNLVVQAIGFTKDPLPDLRRGADGQAVVPYYDHLTGSFSEGKDGGEKIPGLYGAGIAWPEQVTDPHGNVEYAVGFWKFMRFLKRVTPDWN